MRYSFKFASVFLCLVLVASIISCGKIKDPLAENPELMDNVENNWAPLMSEEEATATMGLKGKKAYYDGYIYYIGYYLYKNPQTGKESEMKMLVRYNMNTGVVSPACRDAACTHRNESCPFYGKTIISFEIANDSLYFFTASKRGGHIDTSQKGAIHRYNLNTIKYEKLFEFDVNDNSTFFCTDEYIYYTQCDFHVNDNGYDQCVYSYHLDSGKKEKLFVYGDKNDSFISGCSPLLIDEKGRMLFMELPENWEGFNLDTPQTIIFKRAELKKGAKVETLAEIEAIFEVYSYETVCYHDGKILFQELAERTYVSLEGNQFERGLLNYAIRYVDLETGKFETLVKNTTEGIDVAGEYLYYRSFNPEVIEYEEGRQEVSVSRGKFYQLNLKTGETKEFLMEKTIELCSIKFAYVRGRLYSYIRNHANNEAIGKTMEYDIATGKYRIVPKELIRPTSG